MSADYHLLHRVIRWVAAASIYSFFTEVHLIGEEHVPRDGPLIVAATHHNMMIDPAVLSSTFPHRRILNYWTKATLFANPVLKQVLLSSGNIPVERKSKDNQVLFRGTFEALSKNEAVALFPEGTSYTEPSIMQVKDGAAWAALEYMKWAKQNPDRVNTHEVTVVTAAIVYSNKSKYRSNVVIEYGPPISMKEYEEDFLSTEEGRPRAAVKRLTRTIQAQLVQATINAPDWDTLYAARMARELLWEDEKHIALDQFVPISQTLVDMFSTPDATTNFQVVKKRLLEYYSLLQTSHLTNAVLSTLPLPKTLDPRTAAPLPSRLLTLALLIRDTLSLLILIPFFFVPLAIHFPAYVLARFGARLVEDEEETQAQNKIVFALLFLSVVYPVVFFGLWALSSYKLASAPVALAFVYMIAVYHTKLVNNTYERTKRVIAAWRVLVGVWVPKRWDLSGDILTQYTTPKVPAANPWVAGRSATPPPSPPPQTKPRGKRRPPSRRLIRHVLRARAEAASALSSFLKQLDQAGDKPLRASASLARAYGTLDRPTEYETTDGIAPAQEASGWRSAKEVVQFLRSHGAQIADLDHRIEGDWAALSSEGEGDADSDDVDDVTWIPTGQSSIAH